MFGFRVIRQYEQGIVLRWGRGRVEVEHGHGQRHHEEARSRRRAPDSVGVRGEFRGSASSLSAATLSLDDKKTTS